MNDIKSARLRASFHGETWFTCPYCDKAFEIWGGDCGCEAE